MNTGACLVCGEELQYSTEEFEVTCAYCGEGFYSNARCESGHYICDGCHSGQCAQAVLQLAVDTQSRNPVAIADAMMRLPHVYMHGPEHHFIAGAALLAAFCNSGGKISKQAVLKQMVRRGENIPGGVCGFWGACGAGISTGIFVSLVTKASPMSRREWGLANTMTASSLGKIGEIGGPRCCKRNCYTAIVQAVSFAKDNFDIEMELPERILCTYSEYNNECLGVRCPYSGSL